MLPPMSTQLRVGFEDIVESSRELWTVQTAGAGPRGSLPLTGEMLLEWSSGDLFGLTQNAGMGWDPRELTRPQFLMLSTQGGVRAPDGHPIALGYHTGHWEVGLLMQAAAAELKRLECLPFAAFVSDPCDGRTQGTTGMMDSLPYRNDAAMVFRRLIRSLPTRQGVLGIATWRFAQGEVTLERAAELGCRACGTPGGGCQFLGTAATSQVVGEALGLSLPHSALAPSGQPIWLDMATRSARAMAALRSRGLKGRDIVTDASVRNAMVVHAAFGGSTNLLLHIPAIAHAAGLHRPTVEEWVEINRRVPRLVDALPNGPQNHPTVRVFLAGGVPEVMLHLRRAGLLDLDVLTVSGDTLGRVLDWWEASDRRRALREELRAHDGVDPDQVIMSPDGARRAGLTSTVTFPRGNLAPEGSVIKSTAIDPTVVDADGVYRKRGPARVFTRERDAIAAIKSRGPERLKPGDILVLICRGPLGAGMEEIYQITSALRHLSYGKEIAVVTDARFSGVSTGACIGHVGPEALAGGPIGKVLEGDVVEIIVDRNRLEGSVNLVGHGEKIFGADEGTRVLTGRAPRPDLSPDPDLPDDTRLWAALQQAGGGTWGGCVYDVDAITEALQRR